MSYELVMNALRAIYDSYHKCVMYSPVKQNVTSICTKLLPILSVVGTSTWLWLGLLLPFTHVKGELVCVQHIVMLLEGFTYSKVQ